MINFKKKLDKFIEKCLLGLEAIIALISTVVLFVLLAVNLINIFSNPAYFLQSDAVNSFLQQILGIVIGLEFVKLLMHMTPANILEVLIMAIARHIVVGHGGALANLVSILCIVALFATKRYLIPRAELHVELEEQVPTEQHHRHRSRNVKNQQQAKKQDADEK